MRVLELLKGARVRAGEGRKVLSGRGGAEEWRARATGAEAPPLPSGGSTRPGREADGGPTDAAGETGEGEAAAAMQPAGNGKHVIEPLEPHPGAATDRIHGSTDPRGANARGRVRGHTVPTMKFLFPPAVCTAAAAALGATGGAALPAGLAWDVVREGEYGLVKARTAIPRQERTMRLLGSVGVRVSGARGGGLEGGAAAAREGGDGDGDGERGPLVAWAFLGPDGSLTSLHVEPAFRGRGIAKMLTRRVFGLLAAPAPNIPTTTTTLSHPTDSAGHASHAGIPRSGFLDVRPGEEWAHSDVYVDNGPSAGVARGLGGGEGWVVFWAWVDLGAGAGG